MAALAFGAAGCSPGQAPEPAPALAESPATPVASTPALEAAAPTAPAWDTSRPLELRVTGDDYRWRLRYPGSDGDLDTADDVITWRHMHLPANTEIVIDLASDDFVYTFYVPNLDILEAAVPGVPFWFDFDPGPAAHHDLLGSQMCGYTHPELLGDVEVDSPTEFARWMSALESAPLARR